MIREPRRRSASGIHDVDVGAAVISGFGQGRARRDAGPPPVLVDLDRLLLLPVLDRSGRATGEWKFDGATAVRCLNLLGSDLGMFKQIKGANAPSDVATLMRQVADRGRIELEQGAAPLALPQGTKTDKA